MASRDSWSSSFESICFRDRLTNAKFCRRPLVEFEFDPKKSQTNKAKQPEIWTAIFTLRSEKIRLISVRRAREKEKETYG